VRLRRRPRENASQVWHSTSPGQTWWCKLSYMSELAVVLVIVLFAVPLVLVGVLFVWAAKRDGEEDRALQRRLGIRRRTRLGR
jgi:hypothetical protein